MKRKLLPALIVVLSGCSIAQVVYTFSVNPAVPNVFGFSTSIYQTSWAASIMMKFHGDCYQFWRTAVAHVQPPAYMGFWKQPGCTGAYAPYAGASQDIGGGSCSGGPPGTLFCDNVPNNNSVTGCTLGYDAHNDKLVCLFFDDDAVGSRSVGLFFSATSDGATWSPPVRIPNHYWAGSGYGYMKGPTKFCFFAAGNHPTASAGDQYEMCTTDLVTWTNDQLIATSEVSEGAIWYDAAGVNGLVIIRNDPGQPLHLGTTTNGGVTWTIGNANITNVTPVCAISGGTLIQDVFPAPVLFTPATPAGQVTLITLDRQMCTGSPGAMNHYLIGITFNPMTVIANPSSLPAKQVIWTGPQSNGSVDCGYAGMLQSSGTAVAFGWACTYPAMSIRPVILQMTGAYTSAAVGTQVSSGTRWSSGAVIR